MQSQTLAQEGPVLRLVCNNIFVEYVLVYQARPSHPPEKFCRDGVNVLWCSFHFVWQVFEGSIPTYACFHSENFFVTCVYSIHRMLYYL